MYLGYLGPSTLSDSEASLLIGGDWCNSVEPTEFVECSEGGGTLTCDDTEYGKRKNTCFATGTHWVGQVGIDCSNVADPGREGYVCPDDPWNDVNPVCQEHILCMPIF